MEQDEIGNGHSFKQLRTVDLYIFESKTNLNFYDKNYHCLAFLLRVILDQ